MKARSLAKIEFGVEAVAAASMAAALGYSVTVLVTGFYPFPVVPGMAVAAIAFTGIREALKRLAPPIVGRGRNRLPPAFTLKLSDFVEVGAPVAGAGATLAAAEEPLLLDDALTELGPDSRVVKLFDRDGQPVGDDSEALFDALDKLRRTVR